eukprot:COSAG02_NODE_8095_length_2712_cov_2.393418_2_plen_158_part_00
MWLDLPTLYRKELIHALERDTNFLAMHNIMDYSLLLGEWSKANGLLCTGIDCVCCPPATQNCVGMVEHRSTFHPQDRPLPPSGPSPREGADGDAVCTPFFRVDRGGMEASVCFLHRFLHGRESLLVPSKKHVVAGQVIEGPGAYHMGLVDILQVWDW